MSVPVIKKGYPNEVFIYISFFSQEEKELLQSKAIEFKTNDSLEKVSDVLTKILPEIAHPSSYFLYALGKVLYITGSYELLQKLSDKYDDQAIELWYAKVLIHQGEIEKAVNIATKAIEGKNIPWLFTLNAIHSMAKVYLNIGNYEQFDHYKEKMFQASLTLPRIEPNEKPIINDILLLGHIDNIWADRFNLELIKLENKCNVALQMAKELNDREHIGTIYNVLGVINRNAGKVDDSLEYLEKAKSLFEEIGDKRAVAVTKGNLGRLNILLGNLEKAEDMFLSTFEIFDQLQDKRNMAMFYSSLGNIALERSNYSRGIEKYTQSIEILEKMNLHEPLPYCVLAELYFQNDDLSKLDFIMDTIGEEVKQKPAGMIEAYYILLKALLEIKELNYGQGEELLNKSLKIADRIGRGTLSAKILMNLISLHLKKYDLSKKIEELHHALNYIRQVTPYFKEVHREEDQVPILILEAKIFTIIGKLDKAYNDLQKAKNLAEESKKKELMSFITDKVQLIDQAYKGEKKKETIDWGKDPFSNDIAKLEEYGIKYIPILQEEKIITPLALLILHGSGIPLRSYIVTRQTVRDELLFGGFIVAVKDMLEELFQKPKSQVMVITYGNHKIMIETYEDQFSSVLIAPKDSFALRRKIHALNTEIAKLDLPKKFVGNLSEELTNELDKHVETLFGDLLKVIYAKNKFVM